MNFQSIANKFVCDVPVYEPGRPIEEVARELGLKPSGIIKLASNENALGPSPKALAAMRKALLKLAAPDAAEKLADVVSEQ